MTIFVMVSVRDRVADTFGPPQFLPQVGVAIRMFRDEVNRAAPDNMLYKHPEDFDLFQLGTYEDSTGMVTQDSIPRQLVLGKDCRNGQ